MWRTLPALLLVGLVPACGGPEPPPTLVIGIDGLEWSVLDPLLRAGKLPNMASLAERGVAGRLATLEPTLSPVVWNTIATGVGYQRHGILNFLDAEDRPFTSNARRVPAIWNIASAADREVLAIGWWNSWPAEPVNGRVVASYAGQAQAAFMWKAAIYTDLPEHTYPPELVDSIRDLLDAGAPGGAVTSEFDRRFGKLPAEWKVPAELDPFFRIAYHADATHVAIAERLLQEGEADLAMVYIGLPDVAGHYYWRYREPGAYNYTLRPEQLDRLGGRIDKVYEQVDAWVGSLVRAAPPDARILIVSDHGMEAGHLDDPTVMQSGSHERANPGVLIAAGPGIAQQGPSATGESLGSVLDLCPTLLDWLGMGVAPDMPGRPLRRLMTADWQSENPLAHARSSYADGFRRATPSRVPREGLDQDFREQIIDQLGYAEALGE